MVDGTTVQKYLDKITQKCIKFRKTKDLGSEAEEGVAVWREQFRTKDPACLRIV